MGSSPMISVRDVYKGVRAAAWASQGEIDAFVAEAGPIPAEELAKIISVLGEKGISNDPRAAARTAAVAKLVDAAPDPELFVPLVRVLKVMDPPVRASLAPVIIKVNNVSK